MNSIITYVLARERQSDLLRAAQPRARGRRDADGAMNSRARGIDAPLTIRRSTEADFIPIRTVARLDSQLPPTGPFLVAELGEEIVAALELESGVVVANPFRHTADAVVLLQMRAEQLAFAEAASARTVGAGRPAAARTPRPGVRFGE